MEVTKSDIALNYVFKGKIIKVVDGDTLDIRLDLGFSIFSIQRLRLIKVNAPEVNTEEGKKSKSALENYISDKEVLVYTRYKDKYGRYLADVVYNEQSISDWLIDNKYAEIYVG